MIHTEIISSHGIRHRTWSLRRIFRIRHPRFFCESRILESSPNPRHEQNEVLRYARLRVASNKAQKWRFS